MINPLGRLAARLTMISGGWTYDWPVALTHTFLGTGGRLIAVPDLAQPQVSKRLRGEHDSITQLPTSVPRQHSLRSGCEAASRRVGWSRMRFLQLGSLRLAAGVAAAALAVAAVVYGLAAGGHRAHARPAAQATTTTSSAAPPPTTTTPTPVKPPVDNFTLPFYGGHATRTRDFAARPTLHPPLRLAWKLGRNALLEFPPVIWRNNLYYMDDGATVKRVNIRTGQLIWEKHMGSCHGCGLSASTPALDVRHRLMVVSVLSLTGSTIGAVGGEAAAVSMLSGRTLWSYPVPSGSESSPVIVGNSVYFGDQAGTLTSLNVRTGAVNWTFQTGGSIKAGPTYWHGNLYFGNYAGSFYAVNARTGREVWAQSPGGQFYSTPAVAYGRAYVGNNDGSAFAFSATSGAQLWSDSLGGYVYSGPAVADIPGLGQTVYIGSYDGDLYAINAATGGIDWSASVGSAISGSATVVGHTVYVSTVYVRGSYGFDARTGKQVFYFPHGSYTTVIAEPGALFLMGDYVLYKFVPAR